MDVTFSDDIPLPSVNVEAYRSIYRVENWLRRIALTAYMNKYGVMWSSHIDPQLKGALERRVSSNQGRLYLNAESDDNLIWLTMHRELHRLLFDDQVWPFVQRTLSLSRETLDAKLTELNEIRNMLAHNRALSATTSIILAGLCASFELGIRHFKMETLYGSGEVLTEGDDDPIAKILQDCVSTRYGLADAASIGYDVFTEKNDNVYELVCLPIERNDRDWVNISALLKTYQPALPKVLAFCLNAEGSEYRVLLPRSLTIDQMREPISIFARNPQIWTQRPYSKQGERFLYNPKVWSYYNRRPEDE